MKRAKPYDRDKALDAAMQLFWEKGYHATSLKDLEGALQMKPGSIYAAFGSKKALFLLTLERYFLLSKREFDEALGDAASPLATMAAHVRGYGALDVKDSRAQACMILKTFVDTRRTEPAIAEQTRTYIESMRSTFATGFEEAKRRGEIAQDADVRRLARRFQSYITMLRIELHQGSERDDVAALAEDFAHTIDALREDRSEE